jgi:hypothetical protein
MFGKLLYLEVDGNFAAAGVGARWWLSCDFAKEGPYFARLSQQQRLEVPMWQWSEVDQYGAHHTYYVCKFIVRLGF